MDTANAKFKEYVVNFEKPHVVIQNENFNDLMYSNDDSNQRIVGYGVGVTRTQVFGLKGQLKRRYCDDLGNNSTKVQGIKAHLVSMEKKNDEATSQLQQRNEELEKEQRYLRNDQKHLKR